MRPTCDVIKCVAFEEFHDNLPWGCGTSCKNMQKSFTHEHEKSNDYESALVQMKVFIFYWS